MNRLRAVGLFRAAQRKRNDVCIEFKLAPPYGIGVGQARVSPSPLSVGGDHRKRDVGGRAELVVV